MPPSVAHPIVLTTNLQAQYIDVWCEAFCCRHINFKTIFQSASKHATFIQNIDKRPHALIITATTAPRPSRFRRSTKNNDGVRAVMQSDWQGTATTVYVQKDLWKSFCLSLYVFLSTDYSLLLRLLRLPVSLIFTARSRSAERCISYSISFHSSHSHASTVSKRMTIGRCRLHCWVTRCI